jgi:hypothetical protein
MTGTGWERLSVAMKAAVFSKRTLMWKELQQRASVSIAPGLIAWPDALLHLTDVDVDHVIRALDDHSPARSRKD